MTIPTEATAVSEARVDRSMTRYEKIKEMSIDELTAYIRMHDKACDVCIYDGKCSSSENCRDGIKAFLKGKTEDEDTSNTHVK